MQSVSVDIVGCSKDWIYGATLSYLTSAVSLIGAAGLLYI